MAAFLAGIVVLMPHFDFILDTWKGGAVMMHPDMGGCADRWRDVHELANQVIRTVFSFGLRFSDGPSKSGFIQGSQVSRTRSALLTTKFPTLLRLNVEDGSFILDLCVFSDDPRNICVGVNPHPEQNQGRGHLESETPRRNQLDITPTQ